MMEDDMDVDAMEDTVPEVPQDAEPMPIDTQYKVDAAKRVSIEDRTTEGSFHSARENVTSRDVAMTDGPEREGTMSVDLPGSFPKDASAPQAPLSSVAAQVKPIEEAKDRAVDMEDQGQPAESPDSTVDGSSPPKGLVRKSSLTFASLPAREPLATKKSIGNQARTSNADMSKNTVFNRSSYMGRFTGGKSLGGTRNVDEDRMEVDDDEKALDDDDNTEDHTKKLHNKSSTQELQKRINLLGKTQPARPTKSIPSVATQQPAYPDLRDAIHNNENEGRPAKAPAEERTVSHADEEDDWIMPSAPKVQTEERPTLSKSRSVDVMEHIQGRENISGADFGLKPGESAQARQQSPLRYHTDAKRTSPSKIIAKAASTTHLAFANSPRPSGPQKPVSVSNPTFPTESTTPPGSPASKFHLDGHLSASKSKLQSIMKSAKNLFSSSARISNQAKMETMSPSPMRIRKHVPGVGLNEIAEMSAQEQPVYPNLDPEKMAPPESPTKGRKTRSSTENEQKKREKEEKERQRAEEELKKAREQERQKANKFQEKMKASTPPTTAEPLVPKASTLEATSKPIRQSPRRLQNREENHTDGPSTKLVVAEPSRPQSQASLIAKPKEIRRPTKPTKDTAPKPKPQPVSIRIGMPSQRIPLNSSSVASSQQEHGIPAQKHAPPSKKPSTASQASTSVASLKSSVSSTSSKAKAPMIRKLERKPTAQEEVQKRVQQQREARAAAEEAKKTAQKQVFEQRRLDLSKKDLPSVPDRPNNESARPGFREKVAAPPPQRPGLGGSRPLPKPAEMLDFPRPPASASTQPKRIHDFDQEDELARPARPIPGQNYQPNEAKRRKTDDEETLEQAVRPSKVPPIRQSNIKKVSIY